MGGVGLRLGVSVGASVGVLAYTRCLWRFAGFRRDPPHRTRQVLFRSSSKQWIPRGHVNEQNRTGKKLPRQPLLSRVEGPCLTRPVIHALVVCVLFLLTPISVQQRLKETDFQCAAETERIDDTNGVAAGLCRSRVTRSCAFRPSTHDNHYALRPGRTSDDVGSVPALSRTSGKRWLCV